MTGEHRYEPGDRSGAQPPGRHDFIRDVIEDDLRRDRYRGRVLTRFPPEPNGYLHIGHAKSICLNFGIAEQYGSRANLRFDDTNPEKEDTEYVDAIERDVQWLGFSYGPRALFASDYFEEMYQVAEALVTAGKAYVDRSRDEEIKALRGSLTEPGRPSPDRDRLPKEHLARFRRMRSGELPDGACVLRARIDLAAPNMKMRDPVLYRIRHAHHHRTGDAWCIYPMYDFAHPVADAIEGITHSLCTLEFENNRELYDWVIEHTGVSERHGFEPPRQYEFARLNLDHTVLSKRKLLRLVEEGHVSGWDDPRMPTIAGMRRRGYRPEALRAFAERIGVAKVNSTVDLGKLEFAVRDDLNWTAPRVLGVLQPLRVTVVSWPPGAVEQLTAPYFPPDVGRDGDRELAFSGEVLIDRDDFAVDPPAGYSRLAPGRTVRLRHGYCVTCEGYVLDDGEVTEVRVRHIPGSVGANPPGTEVSGVVHWVSAAHAVPAEARLYDRLFSAPRPDDAEDLSSHLNPASLQVVPGAMLEASLATAEPGSRWQLERVGYFVFDTEDSRPGAPVLNRIVTLRDSWASRGGPGRAEPASEDEPAAPGDGNLPVAGKPGEGKPSRATTRPAKRSRAEYRAEARRRDPVLAERFATWPDVHGLSEGDADLLSGERDSGDLFLAAVAAGAPSLAVARWIINDLPPELDGRTVAETGLRGDALGSLVTAVESGAVAGPAAKEVLAELVRGGGDPTEIIERRGLGRLGDEDDLGVLVDEVLAASPGELAEYRDGKTALFGYFMGQAVKASQGRADPKLIRSLLADRLG